MATVFIFVNHLRERQVLKIICESYGYDTLLLPLDPASLPQLIQYNPESLIIEVPEKRSHIIPFLKQVKANPQTRKVSILCYGDDQTGQFAKEITSYGKTSYFIRPLKTDIIKQVLTQRKSAGASLHRDSEETFEGELEVTAQIMDSETSAIKRIELMQEKIGELLAFPFTVVKVLSVTQSSTTGANDLAQAIEIDPVVVSTVLKVANSALYGRVGKAISSIKDAIVRIGFAETKNIAISLSVMNLFSAEENSIGFDRKEFWYHSLATAAIAAQLAQRAGFSRPEIPFVCGLLHDFGIILLDEFFPAYLFNSLRVSTQKGISFQEAQIELWGMSHNDVVIKLFQEWNMPDEILLPLQKWQNAFSFSHATDPELSMLIHAVKVGDILSKSLRLGRECDQTIEPIPVDILTELKIESPLDDQFFKKVSESLKIFNSFLQLNHEQFSYSKHIPEENIQGVVNFIDLKQSNINLIEYHLVMQEYRLVHYTDIEELKEASPVPDITIIYCDADTELTDLLPYAEIEIIQESVEEGEDTIITIPLLLVGPEELAEKFGGDLPQNVGFISDQIDLRILTFSIQRMLLGHDLQEQFESAPQTESSPTSQESSEGGKPEVSTRIIGKSGIVLSLKGKLTTAFMTELKQLISTLLRKTSILVFNFEDLQNCSKELLYLLDEFRKILHKKKVTLVLCSLTRAKGNDNNCDGTILYFNDDTALLNHIKMMQKEQGVPV